MKLQSKLIATGALALVLSPFAAPAQDEVLINGFDEHQWINEFGFGGTRDTDPENGSLMNYHSDVSNGGEGSMGFSILGLNEETGWAGVFPKHRDRNAFIGDNRDLRFRYETGSFDVRVDSANGNRPFSFKLETNNNPAGTPNGSAVIRPTDLNEWFNISWAVNDGLTPEDEEYIFFYYISRPGITINYDNAAGTPDDPGFTTGDFQVYFDNFMINGEPWDLFEAKPASLTHYASTTDFFAYDQPWRSTTGIAVGNTQFGNITQYGPAVDPPFYLEFDDEFGEGSETGTPGLFALPDNPSQGDRYLILSWSADADLDEESNPGPDAEIVGISTNYYSEPVDLMTADEIKVDMYIPDWGQNALPSSVVVSLVDDNLIDGVQLGDASSATVATPIAAFDTWTTVTVPMSSFAAVTSNSPDLSRIHHIEIALNDAGAPGETDTGRVVFDNLRFVQAAQEPQEIMVDGFNERQWFNTFGFGGGRNTDPPNGALMRYFQGPDVSNGGNGSMGFSVLGLDNTTGFAGIFNNGRENNTFIGEQRQTRYRFIDGSFDVKVVSQNGNRPWTFKYETNGGTGPNGSAFTGPLNFDEWFTQEWSVNGELTPEDEGYLPFYHLTRAGITLNYGGTSVPDGDAFTTGDFLVYFDNYRVNEFVEDFEDKPRGRSLASNSGAVSYTQPYRSTTGVHVGNTQFPNLFEFGPDVDPPFVVEFDDEFDPENPIENPGLLGLPDPSEGDRYMILTWSADSDADNEGADAGIVGISHNYYSEPVNMAGADTILVDIYIPDKVHTALPSSMILTLIDDNLIDTVQLGDAASVTVESPVASFNQWTTVEFPIESLVNVGAQGPDLSRIHHVEMAFIDAGGIGENDSGRILIDNFRYLGEEIVVEPGLGDINGDGIVNVADVTELVDEILHGTVPSVEVGDVNDDGAVDLSDAHFLAQEIANGSI